MLSLQSGSWSETVLYDFCSVEGCADGAYPFGNVVFDPAGNLLGTTGAGGNSCEVACGVLYRLSPNGGGWQETVLHAFCADYDCADGATPLGVPTVAADGTIYGTAENGGGNDIDAFGVGGGVIYKLSGGAYKVLHAFCSLANCADGEYPNGTLNFGASGNLTGTTQLGGVNGSAETGGTVFERRP